MVRLVRHFGILKERNTLLSLIGPNERSKPWKQPREEQTMEANHVIVDMHQQYQQLVQS